MTDLWEQVDFGELASVTRGASPRPIASERWFDAQSEVRWVRISDVNRSDGRTLVDTTQALSPDGIERSRYLAPGTLIMSIAATVGIPVITGAPACIHDGFVAIQNPKADQRFLLYLLKANESRLRDAGQSGSQMNINSDIVRGLKVWVPRRRAEQVRIAAALWDADDAIESLERLINKKREVKQGLMQELLTGRTRLSGFSGGWQEVTLGELGSFLKGRGITRGDVRPVGVPCIRYGELYTQLRNYTRHTVSFVDSGVAEEALPICAGDILFAGSGETKAEIGMATAYIGRSRAVAGGDIVVLRGSGYDPVFLGFLLNTPLLAAQKASLGQGDAVVHISSAALASLRFRLPSREEQSAISSVLQEADAEIETLEQRLAQARAVKVGMMQQLLTGRTRLPVDEEEA